MNRRAALGTMRIFRGALACTAVFAYSVAIIAAESRDADKSLSKEIRKTETELHKTEKKLAIAESDIEKIDKQIASQSGRLRGLDSEAGKIRDRLADISENQRTTETRQRQLSVEYQRYIRAAYMVGRQPFLKMVFNQEDPAQAGRVMVYFNYFQQSLRDEIALSEQIRDEQARLGAEYAEKLSELDQLSNKVHTEQQEMERIKNQRSRMVASLNERIDRTSKKLQSLYEDRKRLAELTRQLAEKSRAQTARQPKNKQPVTLSGAWPVAGSIITRFGEPRVASGELRWDGVLISANEGEPVKSIADGQVVFSDWMRAYGYLTIVDHGNGYMSLYGHNQTLSKKVGDSIKRGEVVGYVGASGGQAQAALYFEIRRQGEPINPMTWMSANR